MLGGLSISDFKDVGRFFVNDVLNAEFETGYIRDKDEDFDFKDVWSIRYRYKLGSIVSRYESDYERYYYNISFDDFSDGSISGGCY